MTSTSALDLDFGEWLLDDRETEAQVEVGVCPRSPDKFLVELRPECGSPDLPSTSLPYHSGDQFPLV